jgi:hypothetical protein
VLGVSYNRCVVSVVDGWDDVDVGLRWFVYVVHMLSLGDGPCDQCGLFTWCICSSWVMDHVIEVVCLRDAYAQLRRRVM